MMPLVQTNDSPQPPEPLPLKKSKKSLDYWTLAVGVVATLVTAYTGFQVFTIPRLDDKLIRDGTSRIAETERAIKEAKQANKEVADEIAAFEKAAKAAPTSGSESKTAIRLSQIEAPANPASTKDEVARRGANRNPSDISSIAINAQRFGQHA